MIWLKIDKKKSYAIIRRLKYFFDVRVWLCLNGEEKSRFAYKKNVIFLQNRISLFDIFYILCNIKKTRTTYVDDCWNITFDEQSRPNSFVKCFYDIFFNYGVRSLAKQCIIFSFFIHTSKRIIFRAKNNFISIFAMSLIFSDNLYLFEAHLNNRQLTFMWSTLIENAEWNNKKLSLNHLFKCLKILFFFNIFIWNNIFQFFSYNIQEIDKSLQSYCEF